MKFTQEALTKLAVLSQTGLENSHEIGRFFRELVNENPAKFDVFSRDLPEALFFIQSSVRQYSIENCGGITLSYMVVSSDKLDSALFLSTQVSTNLYKNLKYWMGWGGVVLQQLSSSPGLCWG